MRRVTLMLAAVAMMVAIFAVVAYAAEIVGTENSEELSESNRGDTIKALAGDDSIDAAWASGDRDRVHGNKGDDYIYVNDQDGKDIAWGGKGTDYCYIDLAPDVGDGGDKFFGCEFVNDVEQ